MMGKVELLWAIATVLLLQADHSVEQGNRYLSPSYGALVDSRGQGSAQQVILPGGFQQQLIQQPSFPSSRSSSFQNSRPLPAIQNGHFQLRNPPLFAPSASQRQGPGRLGEFSPLLTSAAAGQSQGQSSQQNSRTKDNSQYEYYDDTDSDVVYHYSNEDPPETGASASRSTSATSSRGVSAQSLNQNQNQNNQPPKKFHGYVRPGIGSLNPGRVIHSNQQQSSPFIPLTDADEDEPTGYKGRSVRPQLIQRNAAYTSNNPTPLPSLLRNSSIFQNPKNRSIVSPPKPQPPPVSQVHQSILTRKPAVLRGPVNRFTLTSRPPFVPSPLLKTSNFVPTSIQSQLPPLTKSNQQDSQASSSSSASKQSGSANAEEEYEYHDEDEDSDAYYEGEEEKEKENQKQKDKEQEKSKGFIAGTASSSTTVAPPPQTTSGPEIVISVATTKSVQNQKFTTASPITTPKVTFSRATGSSIVVASVQTSRSVATPPISSKSTPAPPQDSSKGEPEYYEEEYTYQDSYPLLNKSPTEDPAPASASSESIMDKLDRVQSELHNGVLAGQYNPSSTTRSGSEGQAESSTEGQLHSSTEAAAAARSEKQQKSLNIISGETESTGEGGARAIISKTLNLQNFLKSIQFKEDVSAFLPPEYKSSTTTTTTTTEPTTSTVKSTEATTTTTKATTTTTTTTTTTEAASTSSTEKAAVEDDGIKFDEIGLSALLPKGYKSPFASNKGTPRPTDPATTTTTSTTETSTTTANSKPNPIESLLSKVKFTDSIAALLPPGYDPSLLTSTTVTTTTTTTTTEKPKTGIDALIANIQVDDLSKFLPPGFKPQPEAPGENSKAEADSVTPSPTTSTTSTTQKSNKLVFPTRPGSLKATRPTVASRKIPDTPPPQTVTVQAGWPTRKTTEFTGWPTSSTEATPSTTATMTSTSTTSTSTTTTTRRPTTTPIPPKQSPVTLCGNTLCKMEAVLRIVGYRWKPEYSDINTEEWKHLERTIKRELDATYRSSKLAKYYRSVEIEGFTRGSVIVDYFVLLENVTTNLTSADVRAWFHASLPPSEQHDVPGDNGNKEADNVLLAADERLRLGRYTIDPKYTDFKVRNVSTEVHGASASEGLIPQWGIAVIVIGLASLMFVVIFGVTVLVNRHRNSKKKNAVSLTQEMLSEFNKSHLGVDNYGADDLYNMDDVWNDKHPPQSSHMDRTFDRKPGKRASSSGKGSANYNIYDSWKTEWNGHYTNGSYYGDSGYVPGRRRSDYDTNF